MKPVPRLRQLEALMAVIHHGSMTKAAEELGITQPAVSRLLSDLGASLGFSLFDRRDGRLIPTQEVRFLIPNIDRVLDLMKQIGEVSRDLTEKRAGHVRIACLPGFATSHLPGVVADFVRDRPGVSLTIEPDRPERILEWMVGEQFDFGITDAFGGHPALESRDVHIRTVCVFPSGHHLEKCKVVTPADLRGEPIIHTLRDSEFYNELSARFRDADVPLSRLVETRQFTSACEIVSTGVGVAVVSELDAVRYKDRGVSFRPFEPALSHRLSLVRPVLKPPSMVTLEFIDTFADSLRPFEVAPA